MASLLNPITSATTGSSSSSSTSSSSTDPDEQMFLTMLVSQLQNQDPLNPTDSTQFVSELAQFSELEQVMAIRSDIEAYHAAATSGAGTAATGSTDQNNTTQTSQS